MLFLAGLIIFISHNLDFIYLMRSYLISYVCPSVKKSKFFFLIIDFIDNYIIKFYFSHALWSLPLHILRHTAIRCTTCRLSTNNLQQQLSHPASRPQVLSNCGSSSWSCCPTRLARILSAGQEMDGSLRWLTLMR